MRLCSISFYLSHLCKVLSVLEECAFVLPSAPTCPITWQHVLQGWQLLGERCKSDLDTGLVGTCLFFGLMWFKQFSESNRIEHTRYYKMILCMKTHIIYTQVQICGRKCFGIVATPPHRWSKRGKIIILNCQMCDQVYISRSYPSLLVEIWATSKIFLLLLFHQINCL